MKKLNRAILFTTLAAILLLTACRTAPVLNIHNAAFPEYDKASLSMKQIEGAIVIAGTGLGWIMTPVADGHIVGTLNLRSHQAVVDVTFNQDDYNIDYKSSANLKYNGTKIHKNYNGWIQNLSTAINNQITTAQYK